MGRPSLQPDVPSRSLSPALVRLMAVTCAVTVANLYYAQPLLHAIGGALHVGQATAALLVPAGQLGYAAGLLLVVPIGDIVRRRPLLTGLLAVDTLALAASAVVPNLQLLGSLAVVIGVTSVVVPLRSGGGRGPRRPGLLAVGPLWRGACAVVPNLRVVGSGAVFIGVTSVVVQM